MADISWDMARHNPVNCHGTGSVGGAEGTSPRNRCQEKHAGRVAGGNEHRDGPSSQGGGVSQHGILAGGDILRSNKHVAGRSDWEGG